MDNDQGIAATKSIIKEIDESLNYAENMIRNLEEFILSLSGDSNPPEPLNKGEEAPQKPFTEIYKQIPSRVSQIGNQISEVQAKINSIIY